MEFFLGAFERDWERRRAALLLELQKRGEEQLDWELERKRGAAHAPEGRIGGGGGRVFNRESSGLSMRMRFEAIARGSQPTVVKLASYGGGGNAGAMISYVARSGELPVEDEKGERHVGKSALAELRGEWEQLFDNRIASRDVGMFEGTVVTSSLRNIDNPAQYALEIIRTGLGGRPFVYAVEGKSPGRLEIVGVAVLRSPHGERLTGDAKATAIIQQRFDDADISRNAKVRFHFRGYGNGVKFATARVRELVERSHEDGVHDERGRIVGDVEEAGALVQREWRRKLHSRKGRDVMHLIVSARSGTDVTAFRSAVRDFLGEQFGGHRYAFSLHDPLDDPRESGRGGRRPHVHAHAIVTMRSVTSERIVTSPQVFRQWRGLMAEKARDHGIDMQLTDRRDLASPKAYRQNQVRPISYAGRTKHVGTSRAAQSRYDDKRSGRRSVFGTVRSIQYVVKAAQVWSAIRQGGADEIVHRFATEHVGRLGAALAQNRSRFEKLMNSTTANVNMLDELIGKGGHSMRTMTRSEFEAYEKRIENLLNTFEAAVGTVERANINEIAAAAREVLEIRREYLELTETQAVARTTQQRAFDGEDERDRELATQPGEISKSGKLLRQLPDEPEPLKSNNSTHQISVQQQPQQGMSQDRLKEVGDNRKRDERER